MRSVRSISPMRANSERSSQRITMAFFTSWDCRTVQRWTAARSGPWQTRPMEAPIVNGAYGTGKTTLVED